MSTTETIKPIYDESGLRLYTLSQMAEEIGRTEERVRQHLRAGRIICDQSYGFKLYRIADGYLYYKGQIKPRTINA